MKRNFFQRNLWFGLAIGVYAFGIFVAGFLLLRLSKVVTVLQEQFKQVDINFLIWFILGELLLGLVLMVAFYVQWQRKKAKGDIIYVDRYVSEEIAKANQSESDFSLQHAKEALVKVIPTSPDEYEEYLYKLCSLLDAVAGTLYIAHENEKSRKIELVATYAYALADSESIFYEFGEGIAGQVAKLGKKTIIKDVPEDYLRVLSGLGSSRPTILITVPVLKEDTVKGVIELASFGDFTDIQQEFVDFAAEKLAENIQDNSNTPTQLNN